MARIARGDTEGLVFHLLSRGNAKAQVFHRTSDYTAFIHFLGQAKERAGVRVFAFAILPNHFHLVGRPLQPGALSSFMQWWLTSHVRRHHRVYESNGHVWQGRYKSFPIQEDVHLLTVLRYTLLNPVRAGLSSAPRDWPWTSLGYPELVDPWPVQPPGGLDAWLREGVEDAEVRRIRESLRRRAPFGEDAWRDEVAKRTGLEATLRRPGRPRRRAA